MNTLELLTKLDACKDAQKWAKSHPDPREAWQSCERVDWMFWLLGKNQAKKTAIVELSCDNAIHALVHLPDSENDTKQICENTISIVRRFMRGEATANELSAAWSAARSAAAIAAWSAENKWQCEHIRERFPADAIVAMFGGAQ